MSARRAIGSERGAAAAEMALALPLLLIILFGSIELGNYFRSEHVLLKGVRDGAVFAARQDVTYNCSSPTVPTSVKDDTRTLVRTGALSGESDLLPLWSDPSVQFDIDVECFNSAGGTTLAGLYQVSGGQVPVLIVTADLPYQSVFGSLGLGSPDLRLRATQQTAAFGV